MKRLSDEKKAEGKVVKSVKLFDEYAAIIFNDETTLIIEGYVLDDGWADLRVSDLDLTPNKKNYQDLHGLGLLDAEEYKKNRIESERELLERQLKAIEEAEKRIETLKKS